MDGPSSPTSDVKGGVAHEAQVVRRKKPVHEQPGKKKKASQQRLEAACAAFVASKQRSLSALASGHDRSRAGGVDAAAVSVVKGVNGKAHLFTTSSCAGRLIVTAHAASPDTPYDVPWLFVSHDPLPHAAPLEHQLREALRDNPPPADTQLWLKLEPPMYAVCAASHAAANALLLLARQHAGLKRCSVVSLGMQETEPDVLVLTDTHRLEAPIWCGGQWIVDRAYLDILVDMANKKLAVARERFDRLIAALKASPVFPDEQANLTDGNDANVEDKSNANEEEKNKE